jgi:DNA-binding transcriptional LysR family regulator
MNMDFDKLRYFLSVSRTENIQAAACDVHASTSALSKAETTLEDDLQVKNVE